MKRLSATALVLLLFFLMLPSVHAENEPIPIYTVEDLLAINQNPSGSYILMEDLDLTGILWEGLDFSGSFDGNGHAILNLTLSQPGKETAISYDGNLKTYDTYFVGFFSTLRNAEVKNLQLLNVQALVDIDTPCFLGGLAGYSQDSNIRDCTVTGILELRAFDRMFGIGGIVGYGNGTVDHCTADVTLICTDTDPNTRDEQFMGGIFSTGYMDVTNCTVYIDGYCSEFGYVHNGGITGMYMQKPLGNDYKGLLTGNTVEGKITFFECNTNRRAYCAAIAGEILASRCTTSNNKTNFVRDERKVYDVELRPEMCASPSYTSTVVAPGCSTYGYTQHTCNSCSYTYRDSYTFFAHQLTNWTVVEAPTTLTEGLSSANCDLCGKEFTRTEPVLEEPPTVPTTAPAETQPPETAPQTQPAPVPEETDEPPIIVWVAIAGGILLLILLTFLLVSSILKNRGGKYLKK